MNGTRAAYLAVTFISTLARGVAAQEPIAPPAPAAPPAPVAPSTPATPAVPSAPPVPAPAPPPAAAAAPAATPAAAQRAVVSPGEAVVHVAVNYRDAWLETRSYVDGGDFARTCRAPCDVRLLVEGREARVVAPGMTTTNIFRFDAGGGTAGVRVDGGSASARRAGIITLAAGIPVAMAGMALFALGRIQDKKGMEIGGIAGLAAGGLSIGVSLPLLMFGTTHVKDAHGSLIASARPHFVD